MRKQAQRRGAGSPNTLIQTFSNCADSSINANIIISPINIMQGTSVKYYEAKRIKTRDLKQCPRQISY